MFLLLGIVKKNGILQVDYTNRLVAEGMPVREAILEANRVRLRRILMTTLSIIAGLIPVADRLGGWIRTACLYRRHRYRRTDPLLTLTLLVVRSLTFTLQNLKHSLGESGRIIFFQPDPRFPLVLPKRLIISRGMSNLASALG